VTDPDRADKVVDLVDQLEKSFEDTRKNVQARKAKTRALNANYDATRDDFAALYDEAKQDMVSNRATMTRIHRQMVDAMTVDEWSQVQKAESKALQASVAALETY